MTNVPDTRQTTYMPYLDKPTLLAYERMPGRRKINTADKILFGGITAISIFAPLNVLFGRSNVVHITNFNGMYIANQEAACFSNLTDSDRITASSPVL